MITLRCKVNGRMVRKSVPEGMTLLEFLRNVLRLTGTKEGCGEGECGACTVLLNGRPVSSCLVMVAQVQGGEIVSVEGLGGKKGKLHPVQEAFVEQGGVQCGFCTPGMVVSAAALLNEIPQPSRGEIRAGMSGNLCRCTGYERIFRAVERAGKEIEQNVKR